MKYLLDTCAISDLNKNVANPGLIAWIKATDLKDVYTSSIAMGELIIGIEKVKDKKKKALLEKWYTSLEKEFYGRILSIDLQVAKQWGIIASKLFPKGKIDISVDQLIGATAKVYNLTLVTRNVKDFKDMDVEILNPWS